MYFLLICLLTSCSYFSFEQNSKMAGPPISQSSENIERGYNNLHVAVHLKDSKMFIDNFSKQNLYSKGNASMPKVTPLQALLLFNLSDESSILGFLREIGDKLDKDNIEKSGVLHLACRLAMVEVVKYLINEKGASIESKIKIEIPEIETTIHGDKELREIREYDLEFSASTLAFFLFPYHIGAAKDPLFVILSKKIIANKNGFSQVAYTYDVNIAYYLNKVESEAKKVKDALGNITKSRDLATLQKELDKVKIYQESSEKLSKNIKYIAMIKDLSSIVNKIFSNVKKCFPGKSTDEVRNIWERLAEVTEKNKVLKEQATFERFMDLIFKIESMDSPISPDFKKYLKGTLTNKFDDIDLDKAFKGATKSIGTVGDLVKIDGNRNKKEVLKLLDALCDCLNEVSVQKPLNLDFLNSNYKTGEILELIKEGYFGVANTVLRFPEIFGIEKNKVFSNKSKKKSSGVKRGNVKKTLLDKIAALREDENIYMEELEETISLARDKGWVTAEEFTEKNIFVAEKRKRANDRKKGKAFKALLEHNKEQKRKKLEKEEEEQKVKNEKKKIGQIKEGKEEKASFEPAEEDIDYLDLDEEGIDIEFKKLISSNDKDKLLILMNKVGEEIDKSFEVVSSENESIRQLLIIRGFSVNKELVLSILENNQKKAMKTLLREVVKEVREKIFNFSKEERKIEITEEMQEIMGKYGEGFKVRKEEEKPKKKKSKARNIEYEIYTIEGIDEGSKSYLFDEEFKERSLLALQNMKIGRGDTKKIQQSDNLFEYRMLGHGEEGNLRIYYKQEENKKIILEVSYKGTDELSIRKVEVLERKSKNIQNIIKIEVS